MSPTKYMLQMVKKVERKTGVVLRGGWRPVMDRRYFKKRSQNQFSQEAVKREGYYSQYGQDKWVVENIFKHRRAGFFVDIGANNGVDISNTYYLEKELGWSGICVEPMPRVFAELARNRRCTCVQGCVAAWDGEAEFLEVEGAEMLSGLAATLIQAHRERFADHKVNKLKLPCLRLDTLLRRYKVQRVDFMSIDTEGSEMAILRGFDWARSEIDVICVENTYHGDLLPEFLYRRGYRLDAILHGDEIYVRG